MIVEDIVIKKISPKKGFLLTNGETTTNVLFMSNIPAQGVWWEIPDENYVPEYDGSDYLYPITWEIGMEVEQGLWYTNGEDTIECIKTGIAESFNDPEYFDIIGSWFVT